MTAFAETVVSSYRFSPVKVSKSEGRNTELLNEALQVRLLESTPHTQHRARFSKSRRAAGNDPRSF